MVDMLYRLPYRASCRVLSGVALVQLLYYLSAQSFGKPHMGTHQLTRSLSSHFDEACQAFDAEAVIMTVIKKDNLHKHAQRFDYIPTDKLSMVAVYGEGEGLPVLAHRISNVNTILAIRVPAPNTYPPRALEIRTMELASNCITNRTRFLLRLDLDAFVAPSYLTALASHFEDVEQHGMSILGTAASGRKHEVGKLGFPPGIKYCLGGTSVAYGSEVVRKMKGRWLDCMADPVSHHSDTEVQRCIYEHTGQSCKDVGKNFSLYNTYRRDNSLRLPQRPGAHLVVADSVTSAAHVFHPLKEDSEFNDIKQAALFRLAPPVSALQVLQHSHARLGSLCYVNFFAQMQMSSCNGDWNGDTCSFTPPARCPLSPQKATVKEHSPLPLVYMLSLESGEHEPRQETTVLLLESVGLNVTRVYASEEDTLDEVKKAAEWVRASFGDVVSEGDARTVLDAMTDRLKAMGATTYPHHSPTLGEIGYRAAARKALMQGLRSEQEYFIVGDNDMIPIYNLQEKLTELMNVGCARYMSRYAGILLLGSSVWNPERWAVVENNVYDLCYDAHDRTMGSFAVLYNRDGALMALKILDKMPTIPFDHAFYQAALRGVFVSVSYVNLFVADHRNMTSAVNPNRPFGRHEWDVRVENNKWNLSLYKWP